MPSRSDGADRPEATDTTDPLRDALPAALPRLRGFVRSLGVPAADRDDVVQEAVARAWRSRHGYDAARPLLAWLCKTALRAWLDLRARRPQHDVLHDGIADGRADPVPVRDHVEVALARLSPLERDLLVRFHRDGRSLAELAEERAMPLNTVKSHLHRARRKLGEEAR